MEWRTLKFNTSAPKNMPNEFYPQGLLVAGSTAIPRKGSTEHPRQHRVCGCAAGKLPASWSGFAEVTALENIISSDKIILDSKQLQPIKLFMKVTAAKFLKHSSKVAMD